MSTTEYIRYPTLGSGGGSGVVIYPTFASFPATAPTGTLAVAADSGILYEFIGGNWVAIAAPGDALSVGVPANGLSITMNVLSLQLASATSIGALSASDWSTFNSKQPAGNYITGLTGDGTATGPGTVPLTLATVNGNVGTFGSSTSIPSFTVNGKGLITSASGNPVIAPAGTLTGSTLAGNVLSSSLTSVGTISAGVWQGSPIQPSYVATLNQNTTGTASNITATTNSTLVTLSSLSLPYSQLTGTPAPLVFSDSLVNTSGTVTLVNDSASPTASQYYGTNGSSTLGYYNLPTGFTNPMTTAGDIIYENATPAPARLGIGTTGQVLTVVSGLPSWSTLPTGGTVTSVSLSAPSIFTVSGSPVTTSGTLALSYSGTALPVANGGTGVTSFTIDQVLLGGATTTGPLAQVPGGTLGYVLTSNGPTSAPTWQPSPGTVSQLFVGPGTNTTSTAISSNTFTTFNTSPTLTFTPSISGNYKIYGTFPVRCIGGGNDVAAIITCTSSSPPLLSQVPGIVYSSASNSFDSVTPQSIYTLTAGTSYSFDIQGAADVSGSVSLNFAIATTGIPETYCNIIAELEVTGTTGGSTPGVTQVAVFNDTEASGTAGGTFTSGAWQTRVLNTAQMTQSWATLSGNQITLAAGTYLIEASAPAYNIVMHQTRFYNVTSSSVAITGTSETSYSSGSPYVQSRSFIKGVVSIAASATFQIQHQSTNTQPTNGFGVAGGFGPEVYTHVSITQL